MSDSRLSAKIVAKTRRRKPMRTFRKIMRIVARIMAVVVVIIALVALNSKGGAGYANTLLLFAVLNMLVAMDK